ncbi:unnamed protein product [Litomosoides sigmodontis]|uniref:C2H2-type domain-containing protein n=1 Tax=Litomosoides sigmodontis TaxID=42156 RepID=A0A3P6U1I6_LITSI|nr:unnamed protein product [Litomosoides sigmodontis]
MENVVVSGERKQESEDRWPENVSKKEIFLHAVEEEISNKWADESINHRKLATFLRSVYEKEARLHPLSMQSLLLSESFVLPKVIFIPPSQVVSLVAEYDGDITIKELMQELMRQGKVEEEKERIRYDDNFLFAETNQKYPMHMAKILFELGRNVVTSGFSIIGENNGILTDLITMPILECHLCRFKTESRIVLEAHKEIPHYVRHRYRCSHCPEFFINSDEIRSHFLEKHNVLARNDYWKTASECPSCAVVCSSKYGLKKHKKLCHFAKTGFTMLATRKQASCAISENVWNTGTFCYVSHQKFEHSTSWNEINSRQIDHTQKRWTDEDFNTDDFEELEFRTNLYLVQFFLYRTEYFNGKRNLAAKEIASFDTTDSSSCTIIPILTKYPQIINYYYSEKNPMSNCICERSEKTVKCLTCGATFRGHVALMCSEHPRRINLMDIRLCPNTSCRSTNLMEFEKA